MTQDTYRSSPAFAVGPEPHGQRITLSIEAQNFDEALKHLRAKPIDTDAKASGDMDLKSADGPQPASGYNGSFLAAITDDCGNQHARRVLATRCALLHALKKDGYGDTYLDLVAEYMRAGPEFCVAILAERENFGEIPF